MKILSIGAFSKISNTSLHRTWALRKNASDVDMIDSDAPKLSLWYKICYHLFLWGLPIRLPDDSHVNEKIRNYVGSKSYDVIWIDGSFFGALAKCLKEFGYKGGSNEKCIYLDR